jgi:hypothetical protein
MTEDTAVESPVDSSPDSQERAEEVASPAAEVDISEADISEADISEADISQADTTDVMEREAPDADEDLLVLESVDEPWELPVWEPTGETRVDEALDGLSRIDLDDVHSHAAAYAQIHEDLRSTLSDLDTSS